MRVLLDCDGVLADLVGRLCEELALRGFKKTPEDVKHVQLALSYSAEEMRASHEIMSAPGFCHGLAWYEGAREFVRDLTKHNFETHVVTAPFKTSPTWMNERLAWLAPEVPSERVHFVAGKYKHLFRGDVLVEDHPTTAHDWLEANPKCIALLIDRPWNRPGAEEWRPHRHMYRVKSFAEAEQVIRECA